MRLEESPYGAELFGWLKAGVPDLTEIWLYMFGRSDGQPGSQIDLITDHDETFVAVYCGVKVPLSIEDPVSERVTEFSVIEQAFEKLARHLKMQKPPTIELLKEENDWLEFNGAPVVDIGKCPVRVSERADPTDRSTEPPRFNIWDLFAGDEASPLSNFAASVDALSDEEKELATTAINWHIDSYFDRLEEMGEGGCMTDSEAIHAAALMCGGRKIWKAAMNSPAKYMNVWPVDDDAEDVIVFSEWG